MSGPLYLSLALVALLSASLLSGMCGAADPTDDWIDPLDPFTHDPTTVERDYQKYIQERDERSRATQDKEEAHVIKQGAEPLMERDLSWQEEPSCRQEQQQIEQLEKQLQRKPAPHDIYYSQFIARFSRMVKKELKFLHGRNRFLLEIELGEEDLGLLSDFRGDSTTEGQAWEGEGQASVQEVHSILENMVRRLHQVDIPEDETWDWNEWIVAFCWVITASCGVAFIFNLHWRHVLSIRRLLVSLFSVLLLVSVPWTWWRLYQEEVAARMARMTKTDRDNKPPLECRPGEMSFLHYLGSYLSLKDKCQEYHHDLHIDPFLDVTPSKALVVTLSKLVLEPLEHLGTAVGKMIKSCLSELPAHLWPVALVALLVIFLMLLVMIFGYKINLFYLFGLEPTYPAILQTQTSSLQWQSQLQEQISAIGSRTSSMQLMLEEQVRSLSEQLGPVPGARPSIKPGELPAITVGPRYGHPSVDAPDSCQPYPSCLPLSGTELPPPPLPGFRIPAPAYSSVVRPPRSHILTEEQVEDADVDSSEPVPMYSTKKTGKSKKRRKAVKSVSDSVVRLSDGRLDTGMKTVEGGPSLDQAHSDEEADTEDSCESEPPSLEVDRRNQAVTVESSQPVPQAETGTKDDVAKSEDALSAVETLQAEETQVSATSGPTVDPSVVVAENFLNSLFTDTNVASQGVETVGEQQLGVHSSDDSDLEIIDEELDDM